MEHNKTSEGFSLKEYIKHSLNILKDFCVFLTEDETNEFKALPTKEAVDRRRMKFIKEKLGGDDD